MDKIKLYQVDAFASQLFSGNPAAVCPLTVWLPDSLMQKMAMENNLSETAFFVKQDDGFYIRWFTPNKEVDLCGHATLAASHVIFNHLGYKQHIINFDCKSGKLIVKRSGDKLEMDFPVDTIKEVDPSNEVIESLNISYPREVYEGISDLMIVIDDKNELIKLKPDFKMLSLVNKRGVIVTAPGDDEDFVSRCFYPAYGIDEDPVTGSAHTTLVPYWSKRLQKKELKAKQLSARGGVLECRFSEERVILIGRAITYLAGEITF